MFDAAKRLVQPFLNSPAGTFLQSAAKSYLSPFETFGKQIGGGVNIELTRQRTNQAIQNLQDQQRRLVEQQSRVNPVERKKLRQAVAATQQEIDRNVAEQKAVTQKEVRTPLDVLKAGSGVGAQTVGSLVGAGNPGELLKFAGTSAGIGGLFGGVKAALTGQNIAQGAAQTAGEQFGRSPAVFGVVKATDPLLSKTLSGVSLPMQKFLSQHGLASISQPLVRRGIPALLNVAQGIPVNIATGQAPITPEGVATDLATGALFGPNQFGSDSIFGSSSVANKGKTLGELQEASQRNEGLGLLADFDVANRSGDIEKIKKAAQAILVSPDPQYDAYKKPIQDMLNRYSEPLTLAAFRGSGGKVSEAVKTFKNTEYEPIFGNAKYFSTDPQYAKLFGNVSKENVALKNPLIIGSQQELEEYSNKALEAGQSLGDWAKGQGFDGIYDKAGETIAQFTPPKEFQKSGKQLLDEEAQRFLKTRESFEPSLSQGEQPLRFLQEPTNQEPNLFSGRGIQEQPNTERDGVELGPKRQFLQTVQESTMSKKPISETEAALTASKQIRPQTYEPVANNKALEVADEVLKESVDNARKQVLNTKTPPSADKSALAIRLLQKYDKEGNTQAAQEILDSYDKQLRESGRFIQAASLWNKMSPEGAVKMLDRVADRHGVKIADDAKNLVRTKMFALSQLPEGAKKDKQTLELLNFMADNVPLTKGELLDSYRYQNMLSNPRTHERNLYQNLFNTFVTRPMDLTMQAEYDLFRHPFNRQARDVSLSDVADYYKQTFTSTNLAFNAAKEAFKTGTPQDAKYDLTGQQGDTALEQIRQQRMPGLLSGIPKLMTASDIFFQTLIGAGEKARLLKKGLSSDAAEKQARDLANEYLVRKPLGEASDKTRPLFVRALDALGQFALQGRKLPVVGKPYSWFVPFVTTPINAAKQMVAHSPAGFLGGSMSEEQIAKATGGSLVTFAAALLAANNRTTWAAPVDKRAKDLFYAEGKKPYSIQVGNKWVPMWYFGPYALSLAIPAAIKHYHDEDPSALTDDVVSKIGNVAGDLSQFIASQTPLSGVGGFFQLIEGDSDVSPGSLLGFTTTQLVPLEGLVKYVNTILDPVFRKSQGFTGSIFKDVSALSKLGIIPEQEAYTDPYGNPSKREGANYFLPYDTGTQNPLFSQPYQERIEQLKTGRQLNELESAATMFGGEKQDSNKIAQRLFDAILSEKTKVGRQKIVDDYRKQGLITPSVEQKIEDLASEKLYGVSGQEKAVKAASIRARAVYIITTIKTLKTKEERKTFVNRMSQIGALTPQVDKEIEQLLQSTGKQL